MVGEVYQETIFKVLVESIDNIKNYFNVSLEEACKSQNMTVCDYNEMRSKLYSTKKETRFLINQNRGI